MFSAAISCVLANRIMLNTRKLNKSVTETKLASRIIVEDEVHDGTGTSFCTPRTLSAYEMGELRAMQAETQFSVVEESTERDAM